MSNARGWRRGSEGQQERREAWRDGCGVATRHAPQYVDDFLAEKRILHAHGVARFALCVGHRYHVARTLWLPECDSTRNLSTRRSAPKPWSWRRVGAHRTQGHCELGDAVGAP